MSSGSGGASSSGSQEERSRGLEPLGAGPPPANSPGDPAVPRLYLLPRPTPWGREGKGGLGRQTMESSPLWSSPPELLPSALPPRECCPRLQPRPALSSTQDPGRSLPRRSSPHSSASGASGGHSSAGCHRTRSAPPPGTPQLSPGAPFLPSFASTPRALRTPTCLRAKRSEANPATWPGRRSGTFPTSPRFTLEPPSPCHDAPT